MATSGIGSTSIDVNSIVSQLMVIESKPLNTLNSRVSRLNANLSEYGKVRSDVGSLQSAARALSSSTSLDVYKASLSLSSVGSATANSTASAGTYSLSVTSLASTQTLVSPNSTDGGSTKITDASAVISGVADLVIDNDVLGKSFTVAANNLSLNGIRDAINSASDNFGVVASVINDGTGFRLTLRTKDTGASNAITDISVNGSNNLDFLRYDGGNYNPNGNKVGQSVAASNATAVIDGVTVSSSTNAFTSAIQGVTFVAASTTTSPVTLSVARDDDALVTKVQNFVNAYNTLLANNSSRYGKDGSLKADATLLSMMYGLSGALGTSGGPSGNAYAYLSEIGVSSDKNGRLSLDGAKLRSELASNSSAVGKLLADFDTGVAKRFDTLTTSYLSTGGLIAGREDGLRASTTLLQAQITSFNARLDLIEKRLRDQFSNLNSLLARSQQLTASLSKALG